MNTKTSLALASATLMTLALGGCASTGMDTGADSPDVAADTSISGSAGSTMSSGMTGATTGSAMAGTSAGTAGMAGAASMSGTAAAGTATTGSVASGVTAGGDMRSGASATGMANAGAMAGAGTVPKASSPAEALSLVALVDQHELKLAQLTQSKQVSDPVMQYAKMMVNDHTPHLEKTRTMLDAAGGMQRDSAGVKQLMAIDQRTLQRLNGLQGDAYARAYVDHMVQSHRMGISMVEASMGVARDAEQREFLQKTRQTMQMHLQRAQQLQGQLRG